MSSYKKNQLETHLKKNGYIDQKNEFVSKSNAYF